MEANYLSVLYNKGATSMLQELKSQLGDMSYSFFDTSSALLEYIQKPAAHGIMKTYKLVVWTVIDRSLQTLTLSAVW